MQDWGEAGTNQNIAENDNGVLNWARIFYFVA